MTKFKKTLYTVLSLVLALTMPACTSGGDTKETPSPQAESDNTASPENDQGITISDMHGREIFLEKPADKIVVLTAGECEILYAIGAGDKVAARGEYCDYPREVLEVPSVESGAQTNVEEIVAAQPDIVIMSSMAQTLEQVNQLEDLGITVAVTKAEGIEDIYKSITLLGAVTGCRDNGEKLIASMKESFERIKTHAAASSGTEQKSVYFEVFPLEQGLWAAGKNTFMDEIGQMLNLKNIFDDVDGWAEISQEQVIQRSPEYIVTSAMIFDENTPDPVQEIISRKGWEVISAVSDGNVFHTNADEITRPGPRLVSAAEMLYEEIYG